MRKLALAAFLSFLPTLLAQNGYITTVAGDGTTGSSGVGGPAVNASLDAGMICVDRADNLYIADRGNNRIVRVDAVSGILTVVAGNGATSSTGDGGPAVQASVNGPSAVVVDAGGNLYISETFGNRIRRIDATTGIITTYAGTGAGGFSGDGVPATSGTLYNPFGIALDSAGNLYIADSQNFRVRRVDATTGILTTVIGNGTNAVSYDGTPVYSASLALPIAVSFDTQGNLLITEANAHAIRRVSNGVLTTFAGSGGTTFNGDGESATSAAIGLLASNVTADNAGNLYFADGLGRVRRVDAVTGAILTVAGNGAGAHLQVSSGGGGGTGTTTCPGNLGDNGPATLATLDGVIGVAFTSTGRLLMADYIDCRVRSVPLPSSLLYTNTTISLSGTTVTATVSPIGGSTIPTGTVQFMEYLSASAGPPTPLANAPVLNGTATIDTSALPAGSIPLMAIYTGDSSYNGSGSIAIGVTGGGSGQATPSFGATVPYPVLVSTPVTIPVTVTGSHGPATGSISLYDGGTFLATVPLVNGTASLQFSSSASGAHSISVQYPGDTNYISGSWTFTINVLATSTITVTADHNPASAGTTVTFTARVSPSTATGQVGFYDGGTFIGGAVLSGGSGAAAVSILTVGTHSITATYFGDQATAAANSAPFTETITSPTSVALTTSGSPSIYAQPVTFTAAVSPSTATGTVQFLDGATLLGTATLGAGSAQFTISTLTGGSHSITAAYSGDSADAPATSAPLSQTVSPATPTITISAQFNPTSVGSVVPFSMSITPRSPGAVLQILDGQTVLATVSTSSTGGASYFTSSLTAGYHSMTASWAGDGNVLAGTSPVYTEQIQAPTTTTVTATGPVTYGQSVTVTATVSPSTASGNIQFTDGGTGLGTFPLVAGVASVTYVPSSAGTHETVATFIDPNNIYIGGNGFVTFNVARLTPVITVATSPNPSNTGQAVTLTSTLSAVPDGASVDFYDGATFIGSGTLSGGMATMGYIFRTAGSHSITASFGGGNGNYNSVTSAAVVQNVKAVTTTTLSAPGTANYTQPVQLTATLSPSTATGTVQFLDGATALGTVAVASGSATLSVSTLAIGSHTITAVYSGDAGDAASTSPAATVAISKANTTASLTSSTNPSTTGQSVTFSVTLTPAVATGSVQFLDGATALGTATLANGAASLATSSLSAGSHSITVSYAGDSNCNPVTSAVLMQAVNKAPATTTLSASTGSIVYGQTVNLTASVAPAAATGTVQFLDGATVLATLPVTNGTVPVLTAANLTAGVHSLTSVYSGDSGYSGSTSASVTVTVSKARVTIGLTASPNPSIAGQAVTFTAAVSPSSSTGSVQFLDGSTLIGTAAVANGAASLTAALAAGTHSVTAVYSGDANYNGAASAAVVETVNKAASTTAISAGSGTISFGQSVSLTASVSPATATGTVQFLDGATVIGAVALNAGSATLVVGNFAVGTHTLSASYGGDAVTLASTSGAVSVTVVKAATIVGLTSSLNPSLQNQAVTFTAVVSATTAIGTVKFEDGATVIGTVPLSNGSASLTVSNLAPGSHSITAVYGGDSNYNGATSAALSQSVLIATRTTLNTNHSNANVGQQVKLTANISPGGATGSVDFMDGATLLATVPLSGNSAVLQVSNLAAGTHTITATYSGAAKYAGSTSSPVTVTIN